MKRYLGHIINCFTKNYFNFKTRATREEYWVCTLFILIIAIITSLVLEEDSIVLIIISIVISIPNIALIVRRFHDIDMSGWWVLNLKILHSVALIMIGFCLAAKNTKGVVIFSFLEILAIAFIFYLGLKKGNINDNKYGVSPYQKTFDDIYKDIVQTIAKKGIWSDGSVRTVYADGTPAHYKSYIGYQFRIDNSKDIAQLITTRFAPTKTPIRELYWIWILQSNNVDTLNEIGCKFWDEWKQEDGTIGKAYGYQIAKKTFSYNSQLEYIVNELKNNPNSRRIMTEIWVPEDLDKMALTPCVHLTQWSVVNNKLYLEVRQRSCDVALGLVANVFQYSILHKLVALECNLEPAEIIYTIHNVHIYDRHYDTLLAQVNKKAYKPATLKINNFTSIYDFKPDDLEVIDYQSGEKIRYEVAI